ncbi:hypothetical protein ACFW9X_44495, partial [Streptomyces sp. NPDC059466]
MLRVAPQQSQPNDPGTLIRTDVGLLQTTRIAGTALRSLKSPDKPEDFMRDYTAVGLTNNLLQITVTGDSDADAVARAKALADAFVADHVRRIEDAANAEAKALLDQRDRMQGELAQVNKAIGDGSSQSGPKASANLESRGGPRGAQARARTPKTPPPPRGGSVSPPQGGGRPPPPTRLAGGGGGGRARAPPPPPPNLESLFASRAELTSRITDFSQRAAEARIGTPQLVAGTQVVDAPRAMRHSLPKAAATNAAIGLVLGLVLGLAVAAVGTVVADRPVLRRDIAANLGASVVAELPRRPGRRGRRRRPRAARPRRPTAP